MLYGWSSVTKPVVYILRGYSGSGKTTAARDFLRTWPDTVRVSRDDIRAMLDGTASKTVFGHDLEDVVTKIEEATVRSAIRKGYSVIVDDTNLRLKYARRWADVARQEDAYYHVWDVTTDVETCLIQNGGRSNGVPRSVIEDQARRFPMPWPEITATHQTASFTQYVPDTSKPYAFGFDLDGTLARNTGRGWYDTHLYHTDARDENLHHVVLALHSEGYKIIIFTGRSDEFRSVVETWLDKHMIPYDMLVMRKAGDTREDGIVKAELFDEYVAPNYNFLAHWDDRNRVVEALRAKGIKVYQVQDGNY